MTVQVPGFTDDQAYPFWYLRRMIDIDRGAGVLGLGDLLMNTISGLQVTGNSGRANVRQTVSTESGSTSNYKGLYQVLVDGTATPYNTILAPITNPRLDQLILRVYDVREQGLGGSSKAQIEWLQGSETAGATLDNRLGAATLPDNSLLLADVLQTVGEVTITSTQIRDRRRVLVRGSAVSTVTNLTGSDAGTFLPHPCLGMGSTTISTGHQSSVVAVYMPVTKQLRNMYFTLVESATRVVGTFDVALYDASGSQVIASTGNTFSGAPSSVAEQGFGAFTPVEAGPYFLAFSFNVTAGSATMQTWNIAGNQVPDYGISFFKTAYGLGSDTTLFTAMADSYGNFSAPTIAVPCMAFI